MAIRFWSVALASLAACASSEQPELDSETTSTGVMALETETGTDSVPQPQPDPETTTGSPTGDASDDATTAPTDDGEPVDDDGSEADSSEDPPGEPYTIFINAGGVVLHGGGNNSAANLFPYHSYAGRYAPVGDPQLVDEVVDILEAKFADFNVAFVTERPTEEPYMMIVLSPDWYGPPTGTALAETDCTNADLDDVGVVRTGTPVGFIANGIAATVGRNLGVEPTENGDDLSSQFFEQIDAQWLDECSRAWNDPPQCGLWNEDFCTVPEKQNGYRKLLDRLGPAPG